MGQRLEMAFDLGRADRFDRGWLPMWRLILVDDHRSNPFVKIMPEQQARGYAEFTAHALGKIEMSTTPQLRQRDLETGRRLQPDRGRGGTREDGVCALADGLRVEGGQDVLDTAVGKQAIDNRPARGQRPL